MTANDVYTFYGESWSRAMKELSLSRSAYSNWIKIGRIPNFTQKRIQIWTEGKLKADKNVD